MEDVFLTGHTGFKGAWLVLLLKQLGIGVHGYSETARPNSLYRRANLQELVNGETFGDVRDLRKLEHSLIQSDCKVVIHFAAQPLVIEGYKDPKTTFDVNINGTLNVLEASLRAGVEKVLVITTDKVYRDFGGRLPHKEIDPLGGFDPYSASKAAADLLAQSWYQVHKQDIRVDIARGGNVIGGGDDSPNRIVTDIESSLESSSVLRLRNSGQVRPWQHALDCLDGYLAILRDDVSENNVWNVGPSNSDVRVNVGDFVTMYLKSRNKSLETFDAPGAEKETPLLQLDISLIESEIGWKPVLDTHKAIEMTANWHRDVSQGFKSPREAAADQIRQYLDLKDL